MVNVLRQMSNLVKSATVVLTVASATSACAQDVTAVLADGSRVVVREGCDTTGSPNPDGSVDLKAETRGAIFAPYRVVSGVNPDGTAGRACSVDMKTYEMQEKDDDGDEIPDDPTDPGDDPNIV